jgi:hypothetical protein
MLRSVWFWFAVVCTVLLLIPVGFKPLPHVVFTMDTQRFDRAGRSHALLAKRIVPMVEDTRLQPVNDTPAAPDARLLALLFPEALPKDLPLLAETDAHREMTPHLPTMKKRIEGLTILSALYPAVTDPDPMRLTKRCDGAAPSAYLVTRYEPEHCPPT